MSNTTKLWVLFNLTIGLLTIASCTPSPPRHNDLANIKIFEKELSQSCNQVVGGYFYPEIKFRFTKDSAVVALLISGGKFSQLPKSILQFHNMQQLIISEGSLTTLPDLRRLTRLTNLYIGNNEFKGPVHFKNLPISLDTLMLERDRITEVQVDDTLPNLTTLNLAHNRINGRINSTFCKLPKLSSLDISYGCCLSSAQQLEGINAVKKVLCKKGVCITNNTGFID